MLPLHYNYLKTNIMNENVNEDSVENAEQNEMTPEEIIARRKELVKFYKDETPLLKARAEYEEYLTKIEEARFARFQIRIAHAQMVAPQENSEESENRMKEELTKSSAGARALQTK